MRIDLDETKKNIMNVSQCLEDISDAYRILDWHDSVYESYRYFDNRIKNINNDLIDMHSKIAHVESSLRGLDSSSSIRDRIEWLENE